MTEGLAGLYLHIPFCARVCPYCDFAVRTGDAAQRLRFTDHLLEEIRLRRGYPLRFDTVYFGGGTPSRLEPEALSRILDELRQNLDIDSRCRVFLEANPEDATAERIADWRGLGIGTLSLGVQAFAADALDFLGRKHSSIQARDAIVRARAAGFETVSIDLIYGLPGQTAEAWRRELDLALSLEIDHLSCYQLTIHERTRFGLLARRGQLIEADDDLQGDLFRLVHRHLADAGMPGYEASQFARAPIHRSRHNTKYWNHTPYLGLGPSAHSFDDGRRWWNLRRTDPWQAAIAAGQLPIEDSETLHPEALALESLMTGLRTVDGVDLAEIRARLGIDLVPANRELLTRLSEQGLVRLAGSRVVPTLEGLALADGLAREFDTTAGTPRS